MLTDTFWLTKFGSFQMTGTEHAAFAIGAMLDLPKDRRVPNYWTIKGIPENELAEALWRGADPKAVEFLSDKRNDARLWAMREFGWVRTAKSAWNLWNFDDETAEMVRGNTGYWEFQKKMTEFDMLDIYEFKTHCEYSISVQKFLDGGQPHDLKKLATGELECRVVEEAKPEYSTAKYSETERKRLYKLTGDNPKRTVSFSEVKRNIKETDGTKDDIWINQITEEASKFKKWELVYVNPKDIDIWFDEEDEELIEEYAAMGFETMPPIVIVPSSGAKRYEILDGVHRTAAAQMEGKKVLAYRPKE